MCGGGGGGGGGGERAGRGRVGGDVIPGVDGVVVLVLVGVMLVAMKNKGISFQSVRFLI